MNDPARLGAVVLLALGSTASCESAASTVEGMDAGLMVAGERDGGDAGTTDGGTACPGVAAGTGPCLTDSECPQGSYCDFTATFVVAESDAGRPFNCGLAVAGRCLIPCGTYGDTCQVPEDCAQDAWCEELSAPSDGGTCSGLCDDGCTDESPCTAGECVAEGVTACPAVPCPESCTLESLPHARIDCPVCICPSCPPAPDGG